jgi:hypothetical protein
VAAAAERVTEVPIGRAFIQLSTEAVKDAGFNFGEAGQGAFEAGDEAGRVGAGHGRGGEAGLDTGVVDRQDGFRGQGGGRCAR